MHAQLISRNALPGLNRIVFPGGISTSRPVLGLRPIPRLRSLTWKTPNPRSSIRSPRRRRSLHPCEEGIHRLGRFRFWKIGGLHYSLDQIRLDHPLLLPRTRGIQKLPGSSIVVKG